ncbi:hypothetical protein ACJJTC_008207 [Scirpophaga incertulas]
MAHLEGILEGQKSLEEKVNKKMEELQQQLLNAGPHKDTVAKVAEEFRTFRELIFNMIGLLRNQIEECVKHIELFENRHRQRALVFMGIPEVEKESCSKSTTLASSSVLQNEQNTFVSNVPGKCLSQVWNSLSDSRSFLYFWA